MTSDAVCLFCQTRLVDCEEHSTHTRWIGDTLHAECTIVARGYADHITLGVRIGADEADRMLTDELAALARALAATAKKPT